MSTNGQQSSQKSMKKVKDSEDVFTPTTITNFFNNYYRSMSAAEDYDFKKNYITQNKSNKTPEQFLTHITFKNYTQKTGQKQAKNVIDLSEYDGLKRFVKIYNECINENKQSKKDDEFDDGVPMERIINLTFDQRLHTFLNVVSEYGFNGKLNSDSTDDKTAKTDAKVFANYIIPQLGFIPRSEVSVRTCVDAINTFFENEEKIKTKIYNSEFPHSLHDKSGDAKGVNVVYLQHISKRYHDDILKMIIQGDMSNEDVILAIQRRFKNDFDFKDVKSDSKMDKLNRIAERQAIKAQLLHPEVRRHVLESDNDDKWIDSLRAFMFDEDDEDETKVVEDASKRLLTPTEKSAVKKLVSELRIVMSFIKIIRAGKEANPSTNLRQCLKSYTNILNETRLFYEAHKDVKSETFEDFLKYFVETVKFLMSKFGYKKTGTKTPLKSFIADLKGTLQFRFNKKLRTAIEGLIDKEKVTDSDVKAIVDEFKDEFGYITSPKTYDINELNVYSKIGKYVKLELPKDFRVAVGVAIVSYIQEKVNLIRAFNAKKRDVVIYIKV